MFYLKREGAGLGDGWLGHGVRVVDQGWFGCVFGFGLNITKGLFGLVTLGNHKDQYCNSTKDKGPKL